MLWGNRCNQNRTCNNILINGTIPSQVSPSAVIQTDRMCFGPLAAVPSGYGCENAIMPAVTGGAMASYRLGRITISGGADGALGRNMVAVGTMEVGAIAVGGLIAGGVALGTIEVGGLALIAAVVSSTAVGTLTLSGSCNIGALGGMVAEATVTVTGTVQPWALGWMTATTEESGLTPAGIARAVWSAMAASNNEPGTMGEKVNAAGSAANPWTDPVGLALADQVYDLYRIQGLEVGHPMTVTPTSRVAGDLVLALSGDGVTTTTVTRS
jgi:hypothetical protein